MDHHRLLELAQENMMYAVVSEQHGDPSHAIDRFKQRSLDALHAWAVLVLKEAEADDATEADDAEFMAQLIDENQLHRLAGQDQHATAGDESWLL